MFQCRGKEGVGGGGGGEVSCQSVRSTCELELFCTGPEAGAGATTTGAGAMVGTGA